ncbi:MAG: energy transducer TonB [Leeuwenhoekiella sp.]
MKKLVFAIIVMMAASTYAQEGVSMKGNTLTVSDVAPVWPGCSGTAAEKKSCFKQQLAKHIGANFKFPKGYKQGTVKEKVIVKFVIDKQGEPVIKSVTGGTKALQEEAKRNISLIPKMTPGNAGGVPKEIKYTVPFTF